MVNLTLISLCQENSKWDRAYLKHTTQMLQLIFADVLWSIENFDFRLHLSRS